MVVPTAAGATLPASTPPPSSANVASPLLSADNPFASSSIGPPLPPKPSAPGVNPYAAPVATGYSVSPQYTGPRPGLPWEVEQQSIGCWFRTTGIILGSPTRAFSMMRQYGGMGGPMLFGIYGLGMPIAAALVLIIPLVLLIALAAGGNDALQAAGGVLIISLVVAVFALVYALIVPTLGALISAAIYHVLLLLVGGARQGFETTFRVVSFAQGSLFWLIIIPYIGPTVMGVWSLVLLIIGLSKAHEVPAGKVALAIFLPLIVCTGLALIAIMIGLGIAVTQQ
jgi:hypothetical protein